MNRSRVTGDLASHGNIFVDIANDRVGIGSTIPGQKLSLPDNAKIALGNSADLQLSHDGTHSYVVNTVGNLRIQNNGTVKTAQFEVDTIDFNASDNSAVHMRKDSSGRLMLGTTTEGTVDSDDLTIATTGNTGITIRSGTTHNGAIHFSDATSGVAEYAGFIDYDHNTDLFTMGTNSARFLSADSDLVVSIGKPNFGGASRVIAYGHAGGIDKNSLSVLNPTASVAGRGAGVAVGGNSDILGSFYAKKSGNADSAGGNVYLESVGDIGLISGGDLTNFVSNTERLSIKSGGKIGINQSSPYADVDITSSVEDADSGTLSEHGIRLAHVGAADEEVIPITAGFLTQQDRARAGIGFISKTISSTDGLGGAIGFYTRNSADGTPLKRTDERVRITEAGRFGIGTNSPGSLFQVGTDTSGKLTFDGANTLAITGPEGGAARIDFIADQGDDAADKWRITNTSGNLFKIQRTTSHTDAVSIDTSGNITFSANSNVNGALRVNTNRTISTQFHVVGGTGSGTAYDAAVFAGGQNSTQGSGVRIHLTGCENDPLNRGTVIEGVMTDNSNGHALVFKTSPSAAVPVERLRILSNGNIRQQKDQSNPNFTLSRNASIGNDNQTIGVIDFASNTAHTVQARIMARNHGTNNVGGYLAVETRQEGGSLTEKVRITGLGDIYSGNADTGGYAFFDNSTLRPRYQFRQGTGTNRGFAIIETRGDANGMDVFIAKSREGNGTGLINAGDNLGKINFAGADGTNMVNGAQIFAYTVSGKTVAADRMPTNLSFRTHDDNTSGLVERLLIKHDGVLLLPTTGKLSVGTTNPVARFQVGPANGSRQIEIEEYGVIRGYDRNSNAWAQIDFEASSYSFDTGGTERWTITSGGDFVPGANDTYDIGSTSAVVRNIFTGDLHLNNLSKEKGNDVDGTNGSWTIQEGQDDLYIINKLNGKKYRIPLEEVN